LDLLSLVSESYSPLSATIGFTFVARRAGSQQASKVTQANSNTIMLNVSGSVASTSNSSFFINRVNAHDADYFAPLPAAADLHSMTERILPRPVALRRRLID